MTIRPNAKPLSSRLQVKEHYAGDPAGYDRNRMEDPRGRVMSSRDIDIFQRLLRYLPQAGAVLEIGAGTGRFTLPALGYFSHVIASDANEAMLLRLKQRLAESGREADCDVRIEDVFALSYPDNYFDAVFCMHVIPRLLTFDDQQAALKSISRVLKPGGRVLFNFRNRTSIYGSVSPKHGVPYRAMMGVLAELGLHPVMAVGKHILARTLVNLLPIGLCKGLSTLDRAMETLGTRFAWDVFWVAEKTHR